MLRRSCAFVSIAFVLSLYAATVAATTAKRTFVASTGNDANPCSITAPCRNFARAITQTAADGEVIVLDSAGYGTVTISKSVSIIAPPGVYAGISVLSGDGITINGSAIIVVLRGLTINGQGGNNGISLLAAVRLRVENCVISNMAVNGLQHEAAGGELIVLDSIVRDNGGAGIFMDTDGNLLLDGVRVEHNGGDGVTVIAKAAIASAHIRNSVMSYNGQGGVAAIGPPAGAQTNMTVESSMMVGNSGDGAFVGGVGLGATGVSMERNAISNNQLSGVSVFTNSGGAGASVITVLTENHFTDNGSGAVKVDGYAAQAFVSRNAFGSPGTTFNIVNAASLVTFKDNSGYENNIGTPPLSQATF